MASASGIEIVAVANALGTPKFAVIKQWKVATITPKVAYGNILEVQTITQKAAGINNGKL